MDHLLADLLFKNIDVVFFLDCKALNNILWFVEELRNFVINRSEVANNSLVVQNLGKENIVKKSISDEAAACSDIKNLKHFFKLVLHKFITLNV